MAKATHHAGWRYRQLPLGLIYLFDGAIPLGRQLRASEGHDSWNEV